MSRNDDLIDEQEKEGSDQDLGPVDKFIREEFDNRLEKLEKRLRAGSEEDKVHQAYEETLSAFRAKNALEEKTKPKENVYLTDYEFITNCYKYLTQTQDEGFCLVTGPETEDHVYALTRRVEPNMKRQGMAGAEPELGSLTELLEEIGEDYGGHLSGYFHSHPGTGKGSTTPSSIDLTTQERLERGGYPVVGCIFSRDGFLRFYSHKREFQLRVSGNGGEQVEGRIFKLEENKVHEIS